MQHVHVQGTILQGRCLHQRRCLVFHHLQILVDDQLVILQQLRQMSIHHRRRHFHGQLMTTAQLQIAVAGRRATQQIPACIIADAKPAIASTMRRQMMRGSVPRLQFRHEQTVQGRRLRDLPCRRLFLRHGDVNMLRPTSVTQKVAHQLAIAFQIVLADDVREQEIDAFARMRLTTIDAEQDGVAGIADDLRVGIGIVIDAAVMCFRFQHGGVDMHRRLGTCALGAVR
mmetsp:Transcript_19911/g.55351  ORF Transcript_19911/g.55351 Transcript_19911/m.55351 type:complete len:228 (-) Transcript_19911:94-777(-)